MPNFCSAIRAILGQRQIRQSPGLALNAHSGNEWGKIPVLTGYTAPTGDRKVSLSPLELLSREQDLINRELHNALVFLEHRHRESVKPRRSFQVIDQFVTSEAETNKTHTSVSIPFTKNENVDI